MNEILKNGWWNAKSNEGRMNIRDEFKFLGKDAAGIKGVLHAFGFADFQEIVKEFPNLEGEEFTLPIARYEVSDELWFLCSSDLSKKTLYIYGSPQQAILYEIEDFIVETGLFDKEDCDQLIFSIRKGC